MKAAEGLKKGGKVQKKAFGGFMNPIAKPSVMPVPQVVQVPQVLKKGGTVKKMAMGGVGKLRHKQMPTKKGRK